MSGRWLILVFLLIGSDVFAGTHLILTLTSKHGEDTYITTDGTEPEYNNKNFGLGIAYDINKNVQARVGFYDNSYYKTSVYAGGSFHTDITRPVAIGLQVGVVSGYGENFTNRGDERPLLGVLPFVQLRYDRVAVEIGYIPSKGYGASLILIQSTFRF